MTAELISGTAMRQAILEELCEEVALMKVKYGATPGLVTLLVGENPASQSYVSLKVKTAINLGFHEIQDNQPESISEDDLVSLIEKYNRDPAIHGILVQLPLPEHINEDRMILAIDPEKDVDGFHPMNVGRMALGDTTGFLPCTPAGVQEMLIRAGVETRGAEVVIVGRSNIVGKPLSIMLAQKGPGGDATVTLVHTKTKNLAEHCQRADILIVAAGVPGLVKSEWIRPGATVIDVGVNRTGFNEATGKAILSGDVDFAAACHIAAKITPVPGGVGPMTIAMLMKNTVKSAWKHLNGEIQKLCWR